MENKNENTQADQELISRVLQGDINAFGVIIKNTERLVGQIVFKMIPDSEDRKDVAQDIFIKAFKGLAGFKLQSKLSTWIAKISYNTCLKHLEKRKFNYFALPHEIAETDDHTSDPIYEKAVFNTDNEIEQRMFQQERSAILKAAIETLPPLYKTLITLYHSEELSYDEIAEITRLPAGTVKNYLFRARKTLRQNLLINYKNDAL